MKRDEGKELLFLVGILLLTRAALWLVLPSEARSIDLLRFEFVYAELAEGRNPYETTTYLNYAPLWMFILWGVGELSSVVGVPLLSIIQGLYVIAEVAILGLLFSMLSSLDSTRARLSLLLWGFCLNPALALLTCQHGHFDVLVGLLILLALRGLEKFLRDGNVGSYLQASVVVGIGIMLKTIPVVLAPLFSLGISRASRRTIMLAGLALLAPVGVGIGALFLFCPEALNKNVLMYTSVSGYFGMTGILEWVFGEWVTPWYKGAFMLLLLGVLSLYAAVARVPRGLAAEDLLPLFAFALLIIIVLGPGYGPQYFYWVVPPLILILGRERSRLLLTHARLVLLIAAATYTVEYAFQPALGGYAAGLFNPEVIVALSSKHNQTLVRLPLFLAYLALLITLARQLFPRLWTVMKASSPEASKALV